jgi:hypothetical protein
MTSIELTLLQRLSSQGPIRGTAQVGYRLWPDCSMQPQDAALAVGKILRDLRDKGYVASRYESKLSRYEITNQGRVALAEQAP